MYLIYRHWYDNLTSMREPETGYDLVGYVDTVQHAEGIVRNGGVDPACPYNEPMFKYEKVGRYNP
jgi:hypothetical protein